MARSLDVVLKDLEAAWNEPDADQRRVQLERAWASDGAYVTGGGRIVGRDALLAHLGVALSQRGGRFEISGASEPMDGRARFETAIKSPSGLTLAREVAFAELAPDGTVKQLTTFADTSPPKPSRARNLLAWATESPVNLLQFFAIVGGALYLLLRISVSIFYSELNVTPEEAGLDEVQMLRESVVMLTVSLFTAVVWAAVIFAVFLAGKLVLYPVTGHVNALRHGSRSTFPERVRHSLVPVVGLVLMALPFLVLIPAVRPSESFPAWLVVVVLLPFAAAISAALAVGAYKSLRTVWGEADARLRKALAGKFGERLFGVGVLLLAVVTIVAFPILAHVRAQQIRDGDAIDGRFEPWQAQRADVKWKLTKAPYALPGCEALRYLGSTAGTVLLFDASTDVTFRVATDDVVVRTRDAGSCPTPESTQSG